MEDKHKSDDPFKKYDDLFDQQDQKYYPTPKKKRKEKETNFSGFNRPQSHSDKSKKIPFWMIFIIIGIVTNIAEFKIMPHMTFVGWAFTILIIYGIVKAIRK
ncbi:MAG: hypothetical protein V3569_03970 [Acholeplasmataceae bacterium]|nr:hypothetical protein [Acholeplasmataceae bacterium]